MQKQFTTQRTASVGFSERSAKMSGFVRKWEKIEFSISGVCVLNFYCRLDGTGKPRELPLEVE